MKHFIWIFPPLLLAVAISAAADTIALKEAATVKGGKITLGDIARLNGDKVAGLSDLEITEAAPPGADRRVTASLVELRLRDAGVEAAALTLEGPRQCAVTTAHGVITPPQVAESLFDHIVATMPWDPTQTDIDLQATRESITVPDGKVDIEWRASPQYQYLGIGTFRGVLRVNNQVQQTLICRATIETHKEVAVAARGISRTQLVGRDDIQMKLMPLSQAPSGAITKPEELAGLVARKTIFPGQVLTADMAEARHVVRRNQIVEVEANTGAVVLQTRARVLADARAGDIVTCANIASKQEFQGVVREDGVVLVQ